MKKKQKKNTLRYSSWKNESSFPASNFWYSVVLDEKQQTNFEVFRRCGLDAVRGEVLERIR